MVCRPYSRKADRLPRGSKYANLEVLDPKYYTNSGFGKPEIYSYMGTYLDPLGSFRIFAEVFANVRA